ncbi:hypothetical protein [Mycobacterium sp. 1164985.4]|nr:hypothetical protein [Mycobacterium sp. 1164985.4]
MRSTSRILPPERFDAFGGQAGQMEAEFGGQLGARRRSESLEAI